MSKQWLKIKRRFFLTVVSSFAVVTALSSCSQHNSSADAVQSTEQKEVVKVGVTGIVSEDILKFVNKIAAPEGLKVQVVKFNDWIQPNTALRDRVIDANFFQHKPFMNNAAKELKLNLVPLNTIYMNTLGLFSKRLKSVSEIPQNATVTIANDVINCDRGLRLMADNGLLKLKPDAANVEKFVTVRDIAENPKNLKIKEVEGVQVVRAIDDVDFIVSTAQTVALAGIKPQSLGKETAKDRKYALALVVIQGRENEPKIQKLNNLLHNPKLRDFINKQYQGRLIPVF